MIIIKRLNIFVDETGEFGCEEGTSELYGVSFTFHEHDKSIKNELNDLNNRLNIIGYTDMIHMADLVMKRGDYSSFSIGKRKMIFKAIYHFTRKVDVKYTSLFVDKRYIDNKHSLKQQLSIAINILVNDNIDYFNHFDQIIMYYDNGQEDLATILESIFYRFDGFEHRVEFDHVEKRLFQVSDMLTFVDKYIYKYNNKIELTKGEQFFFSSTEMRKINKELSKKRFNN